MFVKGATATLRIFSVIYIYELLTTDATVWPTEPAATK
jgi:hypothetical protein